VVSLLWLKKNSWLGSSWSRIIHELHLFYEPAFFPT
jgi:hypothetical protein